ncbi:hypothetical protein [Roseiconus lacunae]|uniref:Uncharacterized protein n=1 Tax=Roseiconus lacunae TaxID=2605694 RepID=A0ABT7PCM2_9BACT|nr:hypothetical protein [Roseiconus lacunae]MDM4014247.1 hypothetical protein [Roseiconus lacunae]
MLTGESRDRESIHWEILDRELDNAYRCFSWPLDRLTRRRGGDCG